MILHSQGRFVQHMQKALTQMNIQLANTIVGETGQKIVHAILNGWLSFQHPARCALLSHHGFW
jgi:hypothetical protein